MAAQTPRLRMDSDSDESEGESSDEVDSDVERMVATSVDRRRQAALNDAVAAAESKIRQEADATLETYRREAAAALVGLRQQLTSKADRLAEEKLTLQRHARDLEAQLANGERERAELEHALAREARVRGRASTAAEDAVAEAKTETLRVAESQRAEHAKLQGCAGLLCHRAKRVLPPASHRLTLCCLARRRSQLRRAARGRPCRRARPRRAAGPPH